jgi:hypothetical protein
MSKECERCNKPVSGELHTCPFQEEINDDSESLCNCCGDCERECADDV